MSCSLSYSSSLARAESVTVNRVKKRMCYQRGITAGSRSTSNTPAHLWAEDWARGWHHPVGGQCLSEGPCLTQEPSVRGCASLDALLVSNPSVPSLSPLEPWDSRLASLRGASRRWLSPWRPPLFPMDSLLCLSSRLTASPMAGGHLHETTMGSHGAASCSVLLRTPNQALTLATECTRGQTTTTTVVEPLSH